MSREFLDEHSTVQYDFVGAAKIRRELDQLGLSGADFYGAQFKKFEVRPEDILLDVGTGDGADLLRIAQEFRPRQLYGLEVPSRTKEDWGDRFFLLQEAMKEAEVDNIEMLPGYAQSLPFENSSISKVMMIKSIYHFPKWRRALLEARRVLVPGGKFLLITNTEGNRERFHQFLADMGKALGAKPPSPFSSRFDFARALKELPNYFTVYDSEEYEDDMSITEDTLPVYLAALDSYRRSFNPPIAPDGRWQTVRKMLVEDPLRQQIADSGAALDTIRIGALFAQT